METKDFYLGLIAGLRVAGITDFLAHKHGLEEGLAAAVTTAEERGVHFKRTSYLELMRTGDQYGVLRPLPRNTDRAEILLGSAESGEAYIRQIDPQQVDLFRAAAKVFLEKFTFTCIYDQVMHN